MTGTVVEAGFKYGLSSGSLSSSKTGTYSNGSISASLSGLTAGTTYYYKAYAKVKGTEDKESTVEFFYGAEESFTTPAASYVTYLDGYEIPANSASSLSSNYTLYDGKRCHSTVSETYGTTDACIYNTSSSKQRIVTHTFEYNSRIDRTYTMLYDGTKRCALWVAFAMHSSAFADNNVSRNEVWAYDPAIPQAWQPNLSNTYNGSNGLSYSRGHQAASEDRQTTVNQNKQTFYYSNMTPQVQTLNGGNWGTLEGKVQGLGYATSGRDTLYVVTGPIFDSGYTTTTDKSGNVCAVPTGYFKCIMKCSFDASGKMTDAKGAAFTFVHDGTNSARVDTTIDAVESRIGFDLFANVPDALEAAAESSSYTFF